MKLYRLCNAVEGNTILSTRSFDNMGKNYHNCFKNDFNYEYKKLYLHFFKNFGNLYYLYLHKDDFICEYDIPDELIPEPSYGYYLSLLNGVDIDKLDEYVIENNIMKFEYLDKMYRIKEYIDSEDILYGDLSSMIEEVYSKEKELKYEKKLY